MNEKFLYVIVSLFFVLAAIETDAQVCNFSGRGNELPRNQSALCAPSEVSWTISYFGLDGSKTNEAVVDWGDGSTPVSVPLVLTNPSTEKYEATVTYEYPKGGGQCTYIASAYLSVDAEKCDDSKQEQEVTVWDTDDILDGGLATDVTVYQVCAGNAVTVNFTDITEFNCMDPNHAYNVGRWIQWEYGTVNTITGDVEVGWDVESFPYKEEPVHISKNQLTSNVTTLDISIPNTTLSGEKFELTLHNWNSCNPYEDSDGNLTGNAPVSKKVYIQIIDAPTADFEASNNPACVGNTIEFINNSGSGTAYLWDFGDGTTSTDFEPAKSYDATGTYTVTLTVINNLLEDVTGACETSISKEIEILPQPEATFSINLIDPQCSNTEVTYTNTSTNVPAGTTWKWEIRKNRTNGQKVSINGSNISGFASTDQDITTELPYFGSAATAKYYVRLVANTPNGCSSTSDWQTVKIKANVKTPAFSSALLTRCQGTETTQYTASADYADEYEWEISPAEAGTISDAGEVTWDADFSGTATIKVIAKGCGDSKSESIEITVTPTVGDPTPIGGDDEICQGTVSSDFTTSATDATSYTWTVTGAGNTITGNGSSATVEWAPDFIGNATIEVFASRCGTSATISKDVLVTPTPQLSNPETNYDLEICSNDEATFTPTSDLAGSFFKWTTTIEGSVIGVTENGDSPINGSDGIADELVNNGTEAVKVIYHITPYKDGCEGETKDFTVIISTGSPDDAGDISGDSEICENETDVIFEVPPIPNAEKYVWTLPAGATITAGEDTNTITVDFTNVTIGEHTISVFGQNGCGVGVASTFTIEIKPGPVLNAVAAQPIICNEEEAVINLALESDFPDTRYSWEVTEKGDNISGESNASDQNVTEIRQSLFNSGTTSQDITYRITPFGNGCTGDYQEITITIKPSPTASADVTAATICSGEITEIALSSNIEGATFSWTSDVSDPLLTGNEDEDGDAISQALVNNSSEDQTVTYYITPTVDECDGEIEEVTVTVKPAPAFDLEIENPSICNESDTEIRITSPIDGISYTWIATVSDASLTGASDGNGDEIIQTLTNNSTEIQTVTYTITPTANGCTGATQDAIISVNPWVSTAEAGEDEATCGFDYTLAANTPVVGTGQWQLESGTGTATFGNETDPNTTVTISAFGDYTFKWTIANGACDTNSDYVTITFKDTPVSSAITGKTKVCLNTENVLYEVDEHAGNTYTWSLEPALNAPTVRYGGESDDHFISLDFGGNEWSGVLTVSESNISCTGEAQKIEISSHDTPKAHAGNDQTICAGGKVTLGTTQTATGGSGSYTYVWSPATGLDDPALPNPTASPNTSITYTLTVTDISGCSSVQDVVNITVKPVAEVSLSSSAPDNLICTGTEVTFTASGAEVYEFYQNGVSVQGPDASNTYTTSTLANKDEVYVIGSVTGACPSESNIIITTVNELPTATISGSTDICIGNKTNLTFNMTGKLPFEIVYTDGNDIFTLHDLAFKEIKDVSPAISTNYSLISVTDVNGCSQTITDQQAEVNVENAVADFSITNEVIDCNAHKVKFVNNDIKSGVTYTWNWGDGTSQAVTTSADDSEIEHTFRNASSDSSLHYQVTLTATHDALGCSDTQTLSIKVAPTLELKVTQDIKSGCAPLAVNFINSSLGVNHHKWYYRIKGTNQGLTTKDSQSATFLLQNKTSQTIIYEVVYEASAGHCSTATRTYDAVVFPEINPAFSISPAKQKFPGSTVQITTEAEGEFGEYFWDFGDGTTSTVKNPESHTYNTFGEFLITLEITHKGCKQQHQEKVIIETDPDLPFIAFTTDHTEGCAPLKVAFTNQSKYVDPSTFLWDFGDGTGTSSAQYPLHTYDRPGKYTVKLEAIDIFGKPVQLVKEHLVEVFDQPKALFTVDPTTVYLPDRPITTQNLSTGATTYQWEFGDGTTSTEFEPVHYYTQDGIYDVTLIVLNESECSDTLQLKSAISAENPKVTTAKIPNAFTPDPSGSQGGLVDAAEAGSNINNVFIPVTDGVTGFSMVVYNRWGKILFMSKDKNVGWDGYYQGELCPADVYTYQIEMKYGNGESISKVGNVTLIR